MNTFTLFHVLLSLVGLASGLVVVGAWLAGKHLPKWAMLFFVTTAATSITGFFFPFSGVTPGIAVGVISLLIVAVAWFATSLKRKAGTWSTIFTICGVAILYFNFFVLVAQLFQHTPALHALAPTQAEPPFAIAQLVVLAIFVPLGISAAKRMRLYRDAVS